MASKSSAEKVEASGVEGEKEGIKNTENLSIAGTSGVKAKNISQTVKSKSSAANDPLKSSEINKGDVDIELGNSSRSSDTASKSSVEKVEASGIEGEKEGIRNIENLSVAGPSGVKAKNIFQTVESKSSAANDPLKNSEINKSDVDMELGNSSRSSDTASKSSVEKVEASGVEGKKKDLKNIENLSVAGPSGVKIKSISETVKSKSSAANDPKESSEMNKGDVDIELENRPGRSDTASRVLHGAEKSRSINLRREESFTNPADTIAAAHEAANIAREAAASCRRTFEDSSDAINVGSKRAESALGKVNAATRRRDANYYRSLAKNCRTATQRLKNLAREAESAADIADATANNADDSASKLAEVLNQRPEAIGDRHQWTTSVTTTAKIAAVDAYRKKYLLLKAMKKCWEAVQPTVIQRTEATDMYFGDQRCLTITINILTVLAGIIGCAFLALAQFLKLRRQTRDAFVALGIIMLTISAVVCMYRLLRYIYKSRKAAERQRRQEIITGIRSELCTMEDYFQNNDISPMQSPSEDEG